MLTGHYVPNTWTDTLGAVTFGVPRRTATSHIPAISIAISAVLSIRIVRIIEAAVDGF